MDGMTTTTDLEACAEAARDGVAMMRDADEKTKAAHRQWIDGALKAAAMLYPARKQFADHAKFGVWCDDNGLGEDVITKDERAALIKIGSDIGYWRETLDKTESRSLRLITAKKADPFSQAAISPPLNRPAPAAPKVTAPDPAKSAPVITPPSAKPSGASFEVENYVLAFEGHTARFPTAPEIVEALEIDESAATKGLAAMVKARQAGGVPRIAFSPAQTKHVEALKKSFEKQSLRFERETEKRLREADDKRVDGMVRLRMGHEVSTLIKDRLKMHAARKEAAFTVDEYKLLLMSCHEDNSASKETRKRATQLLNERAIFATSGKWNKP